jgi:ATP-dependent Clp protease ATP-binding subunit ClpC
MALQLTDAAREFIIDKGSEDDGLDYGARPLRRSVERFIEDPLSEELLRGAFEGQNLIRVEVKEVGGQKQLDFVGSSTQGEEPEGELAAVGAAAGEAASPGET